MYRTTTHARQFFSSGRNPQSIWVATKKAKRKATARAKTLAKKGRREFGEGHEGGKKGTGEVVKDRMRPMAGELTRMTDAAASRPMHRLPDGFFTPRIRGFVSSLSWSRRDPFYGPCQSSTRNRSRGRALA